MFNPYKEVDETAQSRGVNLRVYFENDCIAYHLTSLPEPHYTPRGYMPGPFSGGG